MPLLSCSPAVLSRRIKASALVGFGIGQIAARRLAGEAVILTFHGLRSTGADTGVLDAGLYLSADTFEAVCTHLRAKCRVLPLSEIVAALSDGRPLPPNTTAITFDDGCQSNHALAFPILRRLGLPATVFVTTGYVDGAMALWFQRVDIAFLHTDKPEFRGQPLRSKSERAAAMTGTLARLKMLPHEELLREVRVIENELDVPEPAPASLPEVMLPMTWDGVREMARSGLVEIGGHTHTHPILARCTLEQQRQEIIQCRDRIKQETGSAPTSFAYPNGGGTDFTPDTSALLREAGFTAACTMIHGRCTSGGDFLKLPRYGSPESALEAEATVSGAYELLKQWRGRGGRR